MAEEMAAMSAAGLAGAAVACVEYLQEIPFFIQAVLPRRARLGVRQPDGRVSPG